MLVWCLNDSSVLCAIIYIQIYPSNILGESPNLALLNCRCLVVLYRRLASVINTWFSLDLWCQGASSLCRRPARGARWHGAATYASEQQRRSRARAGRPPTLDPGMRGRRASRRPWAGEEQGPPSSAASLPGAVGERGAESRWPWAAQPSPAPSASGLHGGHGTGAAAWPWARGMRGAEQGRARGGAARRRGRAGGPRPAAEQHVVAVGSVRTARSTPDDGGSGAVNRDSETGFSVSVALPQPRSSAPSIAASHGQARGRRPWASAGLGA